MSVSGFLATYPPRFHYLEKALPTILRQVDRLHVYLNEYDHVPDLLEHPRIIVTIGKENLRDAGKFAIPKKRPKGYLFFFDDDILYPDDYTQVMMRAIERHQRKAAVGVHGIKLARPLDRYFSANRISHHFRMALRTERQVNVIGTGTLALHASAMKLGKSLTEYRGMSDIGFCLEAKRQGVPLFCVARDRDWLVPVTARPGDRDLFGEFRDADEEHSRLLAEFSDWSLPNDALLSAAEAASQAQANLSRR